MSIKQQCIAGIQGLRKGLLNDRAYWFSKTRYSDFFKANNSSYELAEDKLAELEITTATTPKQAMSAIKSMVVAYHQLGFWRKIWWQITRPIRIYQRLYDIDLLSTIASVAKNRPDMAAQNYDMSLSKPGFPDRVFFNNWRMELERLIGLLRGITISPEQEDASDNDSLWQHPESENTQQLKALQEALSKEEGHYSITALVNLYEKVKYSYPPLDKQTLLSLEKKMVLKIHPDKNLEHQQEATEQFKRFSSIKDILVTQKPLSFDATMQSSIHSLWVVLEKQKQEARARNEEMKQEALASEERMKQEALASEERMKQEALASDERMKQMIESLKQDALAREESTKREALAFKAQLAELTEFMKQLRSTSAPAGASTNDSGASPAFFS